jgi:hypothetical protein
MALTVNHPSSEAAATRVVRSQSSTNLERRGMPEMYFGIISLMLLAVLAIGLSLLAPISERISVEFMGAAFP